MAKKNYRPKGKKPGYKKNFQKNNFQDKAEDREYDKGFKAGKSQSATANNIGAENDAIWYIPSTQMAKDVASFPMGISTGLELQGKIRHQSSSFPTPYAVQNNSASDEDDVKYTGNISSPGICVLNILPTVGDANRVTDPINVAASALYTTMQIQSSRNPQYEASDLAMAIVAMADVISMYQWMVRLYGIAQSYSILNRYQPKALIEADGVDYEDLSSNLANFRAFINQYGYAIGSFYLPSEIFYVRRKAWMYTNIYQDANSAKAQFYMYHPLGFYWWTEGVAANATSLEFHELNPTIAQTPLTTAKIMQYASNMIEGVRQSEDIRMMSADLLKAFGAGSAVTVNPISETFEVKPAYVPEVLTQFENAVILPAAKPGTIQASIKQIIESANITNGDGVDTTYRYQPIRSGVETNTESVSNEWGNTSYLSTTRFINFHTDSISPENILVATRLSRVPQMIVYQTQPSQTPICTVNHVATEVVLGATMWFFTNKEIVQSIPFCSLEGYNFSTTGSGSTAFKIAALIEKATMLSNFDWNPQMQFMLQNGAATGNTAFVTTPLFDLDNFTIISDDELERMNKTALLGMFECRNNGSLRFGQ